MASQMRKTSSTPAAARPWVVIAGVLAVALAAALRLAGQSPATAAAGTPGPAPTADAGARALPSRPLAQMVIDWEPALRRDLFDATAFAPPQTQPATPAQEKPGLRAAELFLADVRATLTLQATMAGVRPTAIINGQTHGVGDIVGGHYRIKRIEQRRIVIEREGIELQMACE